MYKNLGIKILLILALLGFAVWKSYPPFDMVDKDGKLKEEGKLNLGLDLQGGMHLVLEIDATGLPSDAQKDARSRAIEILRNRLDPQGVKEYPVYPEGVDRIVIQLPGETDRDRVLKLIKTVAHLEFKLVSDNPDLLKQALDGAAPEGYELLEEDGTPLLVEKQASLTGDALVDAKVDYGQQGFGLPYVSITFSDQGAKRFSQVTAANVNKRLAIVLDGVIQSAPVIRERIPSGRAQITGQFSVEQANDLAIVLRAGALPAPVNIIEERTVGPELGKDSVNKGIYATILGAILVFGFMIVYYFFAGVIADITLLANVILIVGALSFFKATLTLPGIAGLVLTIGMAVDANVLIYERVREEFRLGKTIHSAITNGFNRAFLTIFDSNLTTLITGLLLYQFGSGPVRGFATTLCIGIVTSMFSAIVITRVILDFLVKNKLMERVPMLQIVKEPRIPFTAMRHIAYIGSAILILAGIVSYIHRGDGMYSIDFTGGTIQQYEFETPVPTEKIRESLGKIDLGGAPVQKFGSDNEIIIRTPEDVSQEIMAQLKTDFPDNKIGLARVEKVGSSISKDLRKKALLALMWAMVGICVYVSFRFEFKFAFAAVLALIHDALVSVGLVALTGREMSLPVIAAVLTVVGYSINDTIVIFDRIREDLKLMRKADFRQIIDLSINQTLSRTVITSFTTLLVILSLFFAGGEVINDFAFVMLVGVITGSYSTVFIAVPILVDWPTGRRKK